MADYRVQMDSITAAFGVPVTLQWPAPDDITFRATGVWVPEFTQDAPQAGGNARREPRRILALRRDQVSMVPQRTRIVAPDIGGGAVKGWRVDTVDHTDADHHRVVLVRDDDALVIVT